MLEVKNLTVKIGDKMVLRGVSLNVKYGTIHAIMGPNGSGKSSLAYTIMGREGYEVVEGDILLDGESILGLETHERTLKGIYLGMQDPPALPGVRLSTLILAAANKRLGEAELTKVKDPSIMRNMRTTASELGLSLELLQRETNVGFSGGEKKRSELLQAVLLKPKVVILDEPDSGLDVDGIKKVAEYVRRFREEGKAVMLITHYARLLKHVAPDEVTVLIGGEVVARGGAELAYAIEEKGYAAAKEWRK
ncbi:MAG: Fe-S cluster assembly ATPase SufC [Acidilobaceae archaeon]|nr:Fe-S cluster assembly ATPase SufC [Acidilobaceae archaeon]MCX8165025.1 Fe-S cluster assembly ATPase SufC [Acidilobaceae archaeon]MDW7974458.1 Fe-S cluster assembly ATPase SufC [Sulfolobales archaeon]